MAYCELRRSMNDEPGAFGNNCGSMHVQIVKWADLKWALGISAFSHKPADPGSQCPGIRLRSAYPADGRTLSLLLYFEGDFDRSHHLSGIGDSGGEDGSRAHLHGFAGPLRDDFSANGEG